MWKKVKRSANTESVKVEKKKKGKISEVVAKSIKRHEKN